MDLDEAIAEIKKREIPVYGTSVVSGKDVSSLTAAEKKKYALVMGNEGRGISQAVFDLCDTNLYIHMNSNVESLNVGVACSILLYEFGK